MARLIQDSIRSALAEAELTAARGKGQAMTLEQALAFASESLPEQ